MVNTVEKPLEVEPQGQVRSIASVVRALKHLNIMQASIAAWIHSEQIPTFRMESAGRAKGIDEAGFNRIRELAESYRASNPL